MPVPPDNFSKLTVPSPRRAVAEHLGNAVATGYLERVSRGHCGQTASYRLTIPQYRLDTKGNLVQPHPVEEPATTPRNKRL